MLPGWLYKLGKDKVLRLCIENAESEFYLKQAHVAMGNIRVSPNQTIRRIEHMGVYWPTMRKDIYAYVQRCSFLEEKGPMFNSSSSLFQVSISPHPIG